LDEKIWTYKLQTSGAAATAGQSAPPELQTSQPVESILYYRGKQRRACHAKLADIQVV